MKYMFSLSATSLALVLGLSAPAAANSGPDGASCANIQNLRALSNSAATITAGVLGDGVVLSRETIRAARDGAQLAATDSALGGGANVGGFATQIASAVVEIGDAMLAGDWLSAREMASDPRFQAGTEAVQGYVNSRCSDANGGSADASASANGGDAPPVRSLDGAKGIGDPSRVFAGLSTPIQFMGLLAIIAGLMLFAHGVRFTYNIIFAMIFRRISCFIPATLTFERPDAEPISGRVTILDRRGVGFEPNLLSDATFVAGAEFYETCRLKIGKQEFTLKLLLFYPERMAFDFKAPLTFAQHRTLLGLTMVPPSLSVRPPIDKEKARTVMERRKAAANPDGLTENAAEGSEAADDLDAQDRVSREPKFKGRISAPASGRPAMAAA
ncbi:MAG: hypothetical protein AAFN79_12935 [Pseudomonadota bacterium]